MNCTGCRGCSNTCKDNCENTCFHACGNNCRAQDVGAVPRIKD